MANDQHFFLNCTMGGCGILVPQLGIEPMPPGIGSTES